MGLSRLKFFGILSIMLILLSFSSFAEYLENGQSDGYGRLGRGIFNQDLTGGTSYTRALSNLSMRLPMVADLNNDSLNELVVLAGNILTIYENKNLIPNSSLTLGNTSGAVRFSNMLLYDIDGDGSVIHSDCFLSSGSGSSVARGAYESLRNLDLGTFDKCLRIMKAAVNVDLFTGYPINIIDVNGIVTVFLW